MVFAGMPLWLPRGAAGIDHIILPLILLPAVWAVLFFYAVLDRSLARVAIVALIIGAANATMLVSHFAARPRRRRLQGSQEMIRLPQRETKLMVAVHGWSGVVLGLLLYAVIVTGTAAVFAQEIKFWSAGALGPSDPFARPLESLVRRLAAETPEEYRDDLSIRRTGTGNLAFFFHSHVKVDGQVREKGVLYEVAADDRVVARREGFGLDVFAADTASTLGRFFVELHVRLHLPDPWGLILTGILGIAMLAAAVSGLLMHRHLMRDIFTLRPGAQRLVSRRDLHTVAGTWILPHAFVLAFTGAFFSFAISVGVPASPRSHSTAISRR